MNRQKLIEDNIKLVYYVVHRYYPTFYNDEDIVQCGMVGLCQAAEKWNESLSKFSTYAVNSIRNEIVREFQNRQKYGNPLSLDMTFKDSDEKTTLANLIAGSDDIDLIDLDSICNQLTEQEKEVFNYCLKGLNTREIANRLGISIRMTNSYKRRILTKWRKLNGD